MRLEVPSEESSFEISSNASDGTVLLMTALQERGELMMKQELKRFSRAKDLHPNQELQDLILCRISCGPRIVHNRRWMEACLQEDLPVPTELEEGLRNGVLLAKLGHCFAPDIVPLKKIYDLDQERYKGGRMSDTHAQHEMEKE